MTSWYEEREEESTRGDLSRYPRIEAHTWHANELVLYIEVKRGQVIMKFADNYNWTIGILDTYLNEFMMDQFFTYTRKQNEKERILNYINNK